MSPPLRSLVRFSQANRQFRVRFEASTVDNLRTIITKGVKAIHYSGHGTPDHSLSFENGAGGLHTNFGIDKVGSRVL